jgi:hypothetical protein
MFSTSYNSVFCDLFHYCSNSRLQARRDLSQTVVSGARNWSVWFSLKFQRVAEKRFRASFNLLTVAGCQQDICR